MKVLEFETSKGRFCLVDYETQDNNWILNEKWFVKISEITEEQASEIICIEDIINNPQTEDSINHIKSLYHLLKSEGIFLFDNPYKYSDNKDLDAYSEEKTFYTPFIFKL